MAAKILTITTGGTIFQKAVDGKMQISLSGGDLVGRTGFAGEVQFFEIGKRTGAEMVFGTLVQIRDIVQSAQSEYDGVVLITGTDSMEEVAFGLDLLLDIEKPLVVTGAMKPSDVLGYDGIANYSDALNVAASKEARGMGVLVCLNDNIHLARYVRKTDSALIGSFKSHPGPIGQVRCGRVIFYYDARVKSPAYANLAIEKLNHLNVPIWTMTVSPFFPEGMLPLIDGLVIAGMGTGSLSNHLLDTLGENWTNKLPIVLSSRCHVGLSYDDHYYKGSREKYEARGFILRGYEDLNPLQARLKLCFDLCTGESS